MVFAQKWADGPVEDALAMERAVITRRKPTKDMQNPLTEAGKRLILTSSLM